MATPARGPLSPRRHGLITSPDRQKDKLSARAVVPEHHGLNADFVDTTDAERRRQRAGSVFYLHKLAGLGEGVTDAQVEHMIAARQQAEEVSVPASVAAKQADVGLPPPLRLVAPQTVSAPARLMNTLFWSGGGTVDEDGQAVGRKRPRGEMETADDDLPLPTHAAAPAPVSTDVTADHWALPGRERPATLALPDFPTPQPAAGFAAGEAVVVVQDGHARQGVASAMTDGGSQCTLRFSDGTSSTYPVAAVRRLVA
eukprot:TRINITY_DN25302_c0_g1_i1.p1 TRINITY_DN25302_c0_g1~~TRINITY_DN25302_c0_g1_i1.p1  ORF type:complete len:256 (+),score=75.01 TRINITY_DN25302_c0_g1_i1:76-843(+)